MAIKKLFSHQVFTQGSLSPYRILPLTFSAIVLILFQIFTFLPKTFENLVFTFYVVLLIIHLQSIDKTIFNSYFIFYNSSFSKLMQKYTEVQYVGKIDSSVKCWLEQNQRFADLFNGVFFDEKQIIRPQDLVELNGESNFVFKDKNGKQRNIQRFRDIIKGWNGMILRGILAVEYQNMVHYAMPVKNMMMDSLTYADQIRKTWSEIREEDKRNLMGLPGFFSRFRKEDSLIPVVTLVLYCGDDWDGHMDLHSMFNIDNAQEHVELSDFIDKYVPNYHINLFNPTKDNNLSKFITDLQIVFGMLQYKHNKKELLHFINDNHSFFSSVDYDTCNAITELLNTDKIFKVNEVKKEGNDMCKALDDLYNDGIEIGHASGLKEGRASGLKEGHEISIINLIRKGKLSIEDGAEELEISIDELKLKMA